MQKLDLGTEYNHDEAATSPVSTSDYQAPVAATTSDTNTSSISRRSSNNFMPAMNPRLPLLIGAVAVIAGLLTGAGAYKLQAQSGTITSADGDPIQQIANANDIKNGDVFGSADTATFKDSVEGYLEIGGMDGEGSHKLLRAGGVSQTVYLVSTVTDLNKFDGMNLKIWGETYKGQKVGWLMDVGRVQIIDTQGKSPVAE